MWSDAWAAGETALQQAPLQTEWWEVPGMVVHTFTHFRLELRIYRAVVPVDINLTLWSSSERCMWVARHDLRRDRRRAQAEPLARRRLDRVQRIAVEIDLRPGAVAEHDRIADGNVDAELDPARVGDLHDPLADRNRPADQLGLAGENDDALAVGLEDRLRQQVLRIVALGQTQLQLGPGDAELVPALDILKGELRHLLQPRLRHHDLSWNRQRILKKVRKVPGVPGVRAAHGAGRPTR